MNDIDFQRDLLRIEKPMSAAQSTANSTFISFQVISSLSKGFYLRFSFYERVSIHLWLSFYLKSDPFAE